MTHKNTTVFISDLHLDAAHPQIAEIFFCFLEEIANEADALYILGDFFESYIGNDDTDPFLKTVKKALSKAADKGLSIFFMHGNRDFLVDEKFALESSVTLLPDPHLMTLYGKKILLMHGDSLCTKDKSYQRFRRVIRNPWLQKIFLWLPLSFRQKVAVNLRKESSNYNRTKAVDIMDVCQEAVMKVVTQHDAEILVHGHTHQPAIHTLPGVKQRIVLSAWHDGGHYLKIAKDGDIALINI